MCYNFVLNLLSLNPNLPIDVGLPWILYYGLRRILYQNHNYIKVPIYNNKFKIVIEKIK